MCLIRPKVAQNRLQGQESLFRTDVLQQAVPAEQTTKQTTPTATPTVPTALRCPVGWDGRAIGQGVSDEPARACDPYIVWVGMRCAATEQAKSK